MTPFCLNKYQKAGLLEFLKSNIWSIVSSFLLYFLAVLQLDALKPFQRRRKVWEIWKFKFSFFHLGSACFIYLLLLLMNSCIFYITMETALLNMMRGSQLSISFHGLFFVVYNFNSSRFLHCFHHSHIKPLLSNFFLLSTNIEDLRPINEHGASCNENVAFQPFWEMELEQRFPQSYSTTGQFIVLLGQMGGKGSRQNYWNAEKVYLSDLSEYSSPRQIWWAEYSPRLLRLQKNLIVE